MKTLAIGVEEQELLSEAKFDRNGKLIEIEFPWLKLGTPKIKSWENTILGHISINKNQLKINVNSENRANTIKKKIEFIYVKRKI